MRRPALFKWVLCCSLVLRCFTSVAESDELYASKYAPYLNGKPWPQFPITSYVEKSSNLWVHPLAPTNFPTLQEVHGKDSDFTTVVLSLSDGRVFKTYNSFGLGPYFSEVCFGDFNSDGKPDFMAVKPGTGNGIAGEFCTGLFAFSTGDEYRFTRITTMSLSKVKLVSHPSTKEFCLIHTSLRTGTATNGKAHNFWVHRFYGWNSVSFQPDSKLEPVWIQFLERPNHESTKLLSKAMKVALIKSAAEEKFEW